MDLDLDPDLRESLSAETDARGFATTEAYVRWLLEHRQAVLQPPGERVEARVERLAGRVESLTRALAAEGLEQPRTSATSSEPADWFDASRESDAWDADGDEATGADEATAQAETAGFAFVGEDADADDEAAESVSEFAYSDDLEPPGETADESPEPASEPEDGADDDEIADAIADIDIDEEDVADGDADEEATDGDADRE